MHQRTPSVCVYCGARDGGHPLFAEAATALGQSIAEKGWRLVYGAGDIGLMGRVARAAQKAGGDTMGVIPTHLLELEEGRRDLNRLVITETMHERKKVMVMNSDAIALLPGGAGSLDEFFEALTWRQLGLHAKPIVVLNIAGYWDPLLALIERVIGSGFAAPSLAGFVTATNDVPGAIRALEESMSGQASS